MALTKVKSSLVDSSVLNDNIIDNPEGYMFQRVSDPATGAAFNDDTYCFDKWITLCSANDVTAIRDTDAPEGASYAMRLNKTTGAGYFGICQIKTNQETLALRGETVNFALEVKTESSEVASVKIAVLEWTGTADTVTSDIVATWAASPTWATSVSELTLSSSTALTNSYQEISVSANVTSSANNLIVVVFTDNSESVGDSILVSKVRCHVSDGLVEYSRRSEEEEERRCLRFYWRVYGRMWIGHGGFNTTTEIKGVIRFPVPFWSTPHTVQMSANTGYAIFRLGASIANSSAAAHVYANITTLSTFVTLFSASAHNVGEHVSFAADTGRYFEASADL